MVDVKIDLSKKTETEVMALITDLVSYSNIISEVKDITKFQEKRGFISYKDTYGNTIRSAINAINNCIVKYCEGNYIDEPISMDELEEICE